jgi:hypothetical protein
MGKEKIALDFINVYRKYKESRFRKRLEEEKAEQSSKANKKRRNHLEEHTS